MKLFYTCSLGLVVALACTPTTGTTETTESGGSTTETGTTGPETTGTTTTTGVMTSTEPTTTTSPTTTEGGSSTTSEDLCADVDCSQPDACHPEGECDPATGECVYSGNKDGEPCDNSRGCSVGDSCLDGACVDASIDGAAVDQSLLTASGFVPITPLELPSQTFTSGVSGLLTAIEISAVGCDPLPPAGSIKLTLFDVGDNVLAEATIGVDALTSDCTAAPLGDAAGPATFDLSSSCVEVEAGVAMRFQLDLVDVPAGVCNAMGKKCSAGKVGEQCFEDIDCEFQIGAGLDFGAYAGGDLVLSGAPQMDQDLTFKTIVVAM